jgi:hypothetical protein
MGNVQEAGQRRMRTILSGVQARNWGIDDDNGTLKSCSDCY